MDTFCKVGFHAGPGGNLTGIGDWMRKLDGAGIPFFLKSADHYGVLFEAANLAANSGIAHQLVYRQSTRGQNDGFDYDVPDYNLSPEEAAARHWQATRDNLPPEFDPARVWVEPINEVDKNRCDWLGRFAVHCANLALADGYKVTMFGWSSGEPEVEGWQTEGMLTYLRVCAARPDQAAVSLHEYDFGIEGFDKVYPFHLGRFQYLFAVCDQNGIARPTIHITEWGWALDQVPGWEDGRSYVDRASQVYAPFPQIKGMAIWNLGRGPEFGDVHNQTQRLIGPLGDFIVGRRFPVPDLMPGGVAPVDPALPGLELIEPEEDDTDETGPVIEGGQAGCRYIADITIPDRFRVEAGKPFSKTWYVQNSGKTAWTDSYRLVHIEGDKLGNRDEHPVPPLKPGEQGYLTISLTAPDQAGTHTGNWRMRDGQGTLFGDILFTRIFTSRAFRVVGQDNADFVADITIPAGTEVWPGSQFVKVWRVKNSGFRPWAVGCRVVFADGQPMSDTLSHPIPLARPGEEVEISIPLTAPVEAGTHSANWVLQDGQGDVFGDVLPVSIVVRE